MGYRIDRRVTLVLDDMEGAEVDVREEEDELLRAAEELRETGARAIGVGVVEAAQQVECDIRLAGQQQLRRRKPGPAGPRAVVKHRRENRRVFAANAHALARYAAICQAAGLVPIVEPEVLMDGGHSIERCEEVTEATLRATYAALAAHNVSIEHTILKASMVVSGKICARQAGVDEVAERTVRVLKRTVPAAQPGVVFLSGGQSDVSATAHLNAMAAMKGLPWPVTFSYSRALQNPALNAWKGQNANIGAAQRGDPGDVVHRGDDVVACPVAGHRLAQDVAAPPTAADEHGAVFFRR